MSQTFVSIENALPPILLYVCVLHSRSPLIFEPDVVPATATSTTEAETDDALHARRLTVRDRCGKGVNTHAPSADSIQSNQSSDVEELQQQQHYEKGKM